jgi:uncharacterized protein YbjQ (UPF0145 family)
MGDLIQLGFAAVVFVLAYFIGTAIERNHFKELIKKEKSLLHLPAVTVKNFLESRPVDRVQLVAGNVVIASDYFKTVVGSLASIFGMRITVAESLIDRVRREAIVRMKQQAPDADIILNVRVATAKLGDRQQVASVEGYAYGTAVYYKK